MVQAVTTQARPSLKGMDATTSPQPVVALVLIAFGVLYVAGVIALAAPFLWIGIKERRWWGLLTGMGILLANAYFIAGLLGIVPLPLGGGRLLPAGF